MSEVGSGSELDGGVFIWKIESQLGGSMAGINQGTRSPVEWVRCGCHHLLSHGYVGITMGWEEYGNNEKCIEKEVEKRNKS